MSKRQVKQTSRFNIVEIDEYFLTEAVLDGGITSSAVAYMYESMDVIIWYKEKFHSEAEARASLMQKRMEAA